MFSLVNEVDFAITTRAEVDGSTLLAVAGELDLYRAPALAVALRAARGRVTLDVQDVTFLDKRDLHRTIEQLAAIMPASTQRVLAASSASEYRLRSLGAVGEGPGGYGG